MNTFSRFRVWILFFSIVFIVVVPFRATAQTLKLGSSPRVITTEHFEIIFPEQSRPSAELLASFADKTFNEVCSLLGLSYERLIPVTICPYTDMFNGYMNPFPYAHIVLYDAAPDIEFTTYRNSLKSLFLHELTHVVSLNTRSSFLSSMHTIFGAWVNPAGLVATMFMVEGVTVSFESLEGFGRANDPLVHHHLAQAFHEGKFLTAFQASGVYDHPPFANAYYEYGGLFSAWLQERYGMEKYAELWQEMGKLPPFSFRFYRHGFFSRFTRVYGVSFLDAWNEFATSFHIEGIQDNSSGILTKHDMRLLSVAASESSVYTLDRYSNTVVEVNVKTGKTNRIANINPTSKSIAISSNNSLLLVSGYRMAGQFATAEVCEYALPTGKKTGRRWNGVSKPAYFRDGIAALSSEGHANNLVYLEQGKTPEILLMGNPECLFSAPIPVDKNRIAFIVSIQGIRHIGMYDFDSGKAYLFEIKNTEHSNIFSYARSLSASSGNLLFSYYDGEGLYKLACIYEATTNPRLVCCDADYSGGVFSPVFVGSEIVYRADFSSHDALMRYPESSETLSGVSFELEAFSWEDALPSAALELDGSNEQKFPETNYFPVSWLNPLNMWFPFPLVQSSGNNVRLDGGGFATYLATPTDMNALLLFAAYDARERMAFLDATWVSFLPIDPLIVHFSDGIRYSNSGSFDNPRRETRFLASLTRIRGLGGERTHYVFIPSFEGAWIALPGVDDASAYEWDYLDGFYIPGVSLGVQNWDRLPWELFGRGISLIFSCRTSLPDQDFRYDATLRASVGTSFPVRVTGYGVYDETGLDLDASSVVFGQGSYASAAASEYAKDSPGGHRWVAGGELEFQLFSVEIQKNLSHIYCNRFFGILAWRPVFFDTAQMHDSLPGFSLGNNAGFAHSVILKTGAVVSLIPIAAVPLRFSPHLWTAWKFSAMDRDIQENLVFGISFAVEW